MALTNDDIARLYRRHATRVLGYFGRRTSLPEVAVDLMAETFAQAYRDRQDFRGQSDPEALAWIYGIARHVLASYARSREIERSALNRLGVERRELNDDEYERIIELAGLGEARAQLRRDFAQLDEDQRHVLRLRVVEQRSYPDVARTLGVTEQTARARVSRALRALRTAQRGVGSDMRGHHG